MTTSPSKTVTVSSKGWVVIPGKPPSKIRNPFKTVQCFRFAAERNRFCPNRSRSGAATLYFSTA